MPGRADHAGDEPPPPTEQAKRALRAALLARRRARSHKARPSVDAALAAVLIGAPQVRDASVLACYASAPDEPPTDGILAELHRRGTTVLLPVVVAGTLEWAELDGRWRTGRYGIREPLGRRRPGPGLPPGCDVAVVPALAVDVQRTRLGRGGGFYDRALAARRPGWVCAVVFDDELRREPLPRDPHDVPVDAVATPSGLTQLTRPWPAPAAARRPSPPAPPRPSTASAGSARTAMPAPGPRSADCPGGRTGRRS